jgi:hypothetical protein
MIIDLAEGKLLLALRRRARTINAIILTGQQPNEQLGEFAGQFTLAEMSGEPCRVGGVNLAVLEHQIRLLEPRGEHDATPSRLVTPQR